MKTAPETGLNDWVAAMQRPAAEQALERAFAEDLAAGCDLTSEGIFSDEDETSGVVLAKGPGVLAGLLPARLAFERWGGVKTEPALEEGRAFDTGAELLRVRGRVREVLRAHRTALNFLSHLSGVAARTKLYVDRLAGTGIPLFYTRKALPGLRVLEKHAVALGGAVNHRMGLYDTIKVMDVHVKAAGSLPECLRRLRLAYPDRFIEAEVRSRADLESIADLLGESVDRVWLDNVPFDEARRLVAEYGSRVPFGASGGFSPENIREAATTGVSCVSVGSGLVLEAPPVDMSLRLSR